MIMMPETERTAIIMANQTVNPFADEKPQIVHLEKDQSHYEYCRMQMHEIERRHRRTFLCNLVLCITVCLLSIFRKYVGGFDLLNGPATNPDKPMSVLAVGIFVILVALVIIVLGYLAWANYRSLNIILEMWYVIVTIIGIVRGSYITGLIGAVGMVFYFFSIRELQHEQALSEMDGYPDFHEKFDISKSDIVVATLMAHRGERPNRKKKSSMFSTDYSLRKAKKPRTEADLPESDGDAGAALAEELQKHLNQKKQAEQQTAASDAAAPEAAHAAEQPAAEMPDALDAPAADAGNANADDILAEAEARAKEILAEAVAKANALKTEETAVQKQKSGKKKRR